MKKTGYFDPDNNRFYLGEIFNNEYLTKRELNVFKYILYGYTSAQIASFLNISPKTVEGYTDILKRKLQCSSKSEIMATAIKFGLLYILDESLYFEGKLYK